MKRYLILTLLLLASVTTLFSQKKAGGNMPGMTLNPEPGYIMINEFTYGLGVGLTTEAPYSNHFLGFTTIHGYQVNKSFLVAAGTGIYFYNGGNLVPLFLDLRYRVYISKWTPYIFGDGGFLLDFSAAKDPRLFLNPGIGCSYTASRNLSINLGAGIFTQFGSNSSRDSFINFKAGITYKF